ncbi:hypothetical protein Tco_0829583 [Tanacetum coccineum]
MPLKGMSVAAIQKLVADKVAEALANDHAARVNIDSSRGITSGNGDQGAIELCCWFEKTESTFSISGCAERNKVIFAAATLQGRALRWFNEFVLLCSDVVPNDKKKVEAYIKGLPENIKGETTYFKPVVLNDAVRIAHTLMEQKVQAKAERVTESNKRIWENSNNN